MKNKENLTHRDLEKGSVVIYSGNNSEFTNKRFLMIESPDGNEGNIFLDLNTFMTVSRFDYPGFYRNEVFNISECILIVNNMTQDEKNEYKGPVKKLFFTNSNADWNKDYSLGEVVLPTLAGNRPNYDYTNNSYMVIQWGKDTMGNRRRLLNLSDFRVIPRSSTKTESIDLYTRAYYITTSGVINIYE